MIIPNIVNDLIQGSPEWIVFRAKHLGASDAAAIMGLSPYKTAYQLWCEKTNRAQAFEGNAATEAGHRMEDVARASYEIQQGFVEMPPVCVEHSKHPIISSSLDGLSDDHKTILEIKYASQKSHEMALSGQVPEHYYIQCQWQLACVPEAEVCHYFSYRDGNSALIEVKPNADLQAKLIEAGLAFWDLVKLDTPPPLTDKDAKLVDDPQVIDICKRLLSLKDVKGKEAKQESDALKVKAVVIGGHVRIRCGGVLISRSVTKSGADSYRMTVSGGNE